MEGKLEFWDDHTNSSDENIITIKDNQGFDAHVLNVYHKNGVFVFEEACDSCFNIKLNKEQALKLVDELKHWIESN